jgi:two-component system, chemotaxis family, sensor kinase CheA
VLGMEMPTGQGSSGDDRALILCHVGRGRTLVLDVPEVRDHDELVIKPLPPTLASLGIYGGVTLPDNGRPMLVLDVIGIAEKMIGNIDLGDGDLSDTGQHGGDDADTASDWLHFSPTGGGVEMAVEMRFVRRICDVPRDMIHFAGGQMVAQFDDRLIVIDAVNYDPGDGPFARMILVGDGIGGASDQRTAMLPVAAIGSLIRLNKAMVPSQSKGRLIGVTQHGRRVIEMIDVPTLLDEVAALSLEKPRAVTVPRWVVPGAGE